MYEEVGRSMDNDLQTIMQLAGRLDRLMDAIETIKERQEEMASDITEIKKAVYHPDLGIYARLRVLEQWRTTSTKIIWFLGTSFGGLLIASLWVRFFNN